MPRFVSNSFSNPFSFFLFFLTNLYPSLKVRFGQVKRKLGIDSNVTPKKGSSASPASASTPSKVRKTPTGRAGTKGRARGGRAKKEDDEAAVAADAEAGNDTTTAVESPFAKGEESNSTNFKAEHGGDPF